LSIFVSRVAMEMPQWVPQDSGLKEICQLLAEYQKPSANHAQIYQKIEEYSSMPEFSNYLAYLLSFGTNFPLEVRQCAGLLLKNKLRSQFSSLPEANLKYIHGTTLQALSLRSPALRQTAGTVISAIVCAVGLRGQVDLFAHLTTLINSNEIPQKEGGLDTIYKIAEDCPQAVESLLMKEDETLCNLLFLVLNQFMNEVSEIRRLAVEVLNLIVSSMFMQNERFIQLYRDGLFRLNTDQEPDIRKRVCSGMTRLISSHPDCMEPYLKDVIYFMLECMKHKDTSVVMESCEFWTAFVDSQFEPTDLRPILGELLPILLNNMVYEDDDEDVLMAREAETEKQENESDLPLFLPGRKETSTDDDDEDEVCSAWTLRKCSATALDKLSTLFGDELLQHILPLIEQRIQSLEWKRRESAVLVLGAISGGCRSGLRPHLDAILEQLLACAADPEALVRAISCWALSRFAGWIFERAATSPTGENDVRQIFEKILESMHDNNRQVQQAACSALATIEEFAGVVLLPHFKVILEHLAQACMQYGKRNLRIVYDATSVLAERYGAQLVQAHHRSVIMPALNALYNRMPDDDKELQPLFGCLSSLAVAFGRGFEEYTLPVYERCIRIANAQLQASKSADGSKHAADSSFTVSALELLSGLVEGLGASIESLVGESNLSELLFYFCQSDDSSVRQSAFALLGELAKVCPSHLRSNLPHFLPLAVENFAHQALTENDLHACNNACWALGELSLHSAHDQLQPVAVKALESCVNILMNSRSLSRSLVENATITLGRLALHCAQDFAPYQHMYLGVWCQMLRNIRDDIEKEQAFEGLLRIVMVNLQGASDSFPSICSAVASWNYGMGEQLKMQIQEVMQSLKQVLQAKGQWDAMWELVPDPVKQKLQNPQHW